jgi:positive regulator of sigma E activity
MRHRIPTAVLFLVAAICYMLSFSEAAALFGVLALLIEAKAWCQVFSRKSVAPRVRIHVAPIEPVLLL